MITYAPWYWSLAFAVLMVGSRVLTNMMFFRNRAFPPRWVSVLYLLGFYGLIATFFWSMMAMRWWACLPVLGIYLLTELVPSVTPQIAAVEAIAAWEIANRQAAQELEHLEPGDEQERKVIARAHEIMEKQGWKDK